MNPTPPTPVWTGPVILTLCISGSAFVMSGMALGWQIISWLRSGSRVRVSAYWGVDVQGPAYVAIEATNSGRLATEVSGFGFELTPKGFPLIVDSVDLFGKRWELPARLPPGASVSFRYGEPSLREQLIEHKSSGEGVRPFVFTGHGQVLGKPVNLGKMIAERTAD